MAPLNLPSISGLFVTATYAGIGKTVIASAIGQWLAQRGVRVAPLKPVDTGCVRRREGLVSEDAELLAHFCAARHPLDLICPVRYQEQFIPSIAAKRASRPIDYEAIQRSIALMSRDADVLLVEGYGAAMTPLDDKLTTLDLAAMLKLPAVIVAPPGERAISPTLLTIHALRARNVHVAGVVVNRYPADLPSIGEELSPREIERHGRTSVLCIVPNEPFASPSQMPPGIAAAVGQVDWSALARAEDRG